MPGVSDDALKEHGSTLEEARADLFALYYLADPKLLELGLLDNENAYKAEYYKYILNGLMTQLMRIEYGKDVEEAHMRNRQLISKWCYERGKADNVIELVKRDGKTFVKSTIIRNSVTCSVSCSPKFSESSRKATMRQERLLWRRML